MSEATGGGKGHGRPGRPAAETPEKRIERLERELQNAKEAAREAQQRTFAVVGQAILAEAEGDTELKARLQDILRRRVKGNTAKAAIASLLI